jgi:hypothetical protein
VSYEKIRNREKRNKKQRDRVQTGLPGCGGRPSVYFFAALYCILFLWKCGDRKAGRGGTDRRRSGMGDKRKRKNRIILGRYRKSGIYCM